MLLWRNVTVFQTLNCWLLVYIHIMRRGNSQSPLWLLFTSHQQLTSYTRLSRDAKLGIRTLSVSFLGILIMCLSALHYQRSTTMEGVSLELLNKRGRLSGRRTKHRWGGCRRKWRWDWGRTEGNWRVGFSRTNQMRCGLAWCRSPA